MGQTAFPYNIAIEKPTHDALEESATLWVKNPEVFLHAFLRGGIAPTEN